MGTEGASGSHPPDNLEEALYVLLGVVEVWRDAHAPAAHADENALCREPGGEVFGGGGAELEPDHVLGPHLPRDRLDAALPSLSLDEVGQPSDGLGDVLNAPVEDLAQRLVRHREQGEVAPLADIVAPGAGLEGVLVVHERREVLGAATVDPVVLYGRPLPPLLPDVQEADPVW